MMPERLLRLRSIEQALAEPHDFGEAVDAETLRGAQEIVESVRRGGEVALREHALRFGERTADEPLTLGRADLQAALLELQKDDRAVLERVAARIESFAQAQRASLHDLSIQVPGATIGHTFAPVDHAGCYAPGGRFPLPSSVLMTAMTARAAGVSQVTVASPRPTLVTKAACAIAGADRLLCVGGAHAIAALAYGFGAQSAVDVIVGPGNRWVTAAKHLVSVQVGIDMLAGPSELLVIADETADAQWVAADLLAQAEHDPDALPVLIATHESVVENVERALSQQLEVLATRETARAALANGYAVIAKSLDDAAALANAIAPEHLEVHVGNDEGVLAKLRHYGGLFVGKAAAEVFGDYGLGPNHVLPTGRRARYTGGLSVLNFLRMRTFIRANQPQLDKEAIADCVRLAELEGLYGHANAARLRY
jgi:phosphoribosyl-ATP pyrophosphohydrolase/phosphoribosyl-AMP cyclohydrolase/histidinol dehydrogenase